MPSLWSRSRGMAPTAVLDAGSWDAAVAESRRRMVLASAVLDRTYKRDADGQFATTGGGYHAGADISGSADYDSIYAAMAEPEIGSRPRHAPKTGDLALGQIQHAQGFDGHPRVVSREEFDRALAGGEVTETFRGIGGPVGTSAAAVQAEQFRTGDLYPGTGIYGNGTYVAMDRSHANDFAGRSTGVPDNGAVVRIGLRRDARVISHHDLRAEMKAHVDKDRTAHIDRLDREMRHAASRTDTIEDQIAVYNDYNRRKVAAAGHAYLVNQDEGRFAALRGYDAIDVPGGMGGDQMIILNRTALIVEEA